MLKIQFDSGLTSFPTPTCLPRTLFPLSPSLGQAIFCTGFIPAAQSSLQAQSCSNSSMTPTAHCLRVKRHRFFPACPAHVSLDLIGCNRVKCPPLNQSLTEKGVASISLSGFRGSVATWISPMESGGLPRRDWETTARRRGRIRGRGKTGVLLPSRGVQGHQ